LRGATGLSEAVAEPTRQLLVRCQPRPRRTGLRPCGRMC
jgi:hypothetical protein